MPLVCELTLQAYAALSFEIEEFISFEASSIGQADKEQEDTKSLQLRRVN